MSVFTQSRSYVIRIIFAVAFFVIIARLFALQVVSSKYEKAAYENALFKKIVYPPRGIVYDRKNKAIVTNQQMTDLMVVPSEARGADTAYICELLDIDTAEFKTRMLSAIVKNGRARPSVFEALLTPEKHARLEENSWRLGIGFYLQERSVRQFPLNSGGHFVGYIGEVDSAIIARSDGFYLSGDYVGRSGMESTYEKVLMGKRGVQYWIKDNRNKLVGRFENGEMDEASEAGRGLHTYVDADLQQLAEKLLNNKVGSIVAIEPKTGGIIAMASGPDYNPNDLSGGEKQKNYSKLVLDVSAPLLNRAIKGQYPAGSTYKPLGALIGLDEGVITPRSGIGCNGAYYGCARPVKCTEHWAGHAANLRLAIAHSCNSFFSMAYRVTVDNPQYGGVKQGYAKWREYMNHFGYGVHLGVDLPSEDKGNIPDTSVYNKEYRGSWNSCTNVTLGIGQDKMLVTPLQMANAICIVANKGYYYTPHFVKDFENETKDDTLLSKYRVKHEVLTHIPDTSYETVHSGMQDVVEIGTARIAKIAGINICAKTGTAENYRVINGVRTKLKDNSMFVAFAPRENPKIVVAVVVENAGFGATWAAPMASLMIEKFLNDTLRADRIKEVERINAANLMPSWLEAEQKKADSTRAVYYFNLTKDSTYLKKFFKPKQQETKKDTSKPKQLIAVKPSSPKKDVPKPAAPDTQRIGYLRRSEWIDDLQKHLEKRRAALS